MNIFRCKLHCIVLLLTICITAISCEKDWSEPDFTAPSVDVNEENLFNVRYVQRLKKSSTPFDSLRLSFRPTIYMKATVVANDEHGNFDKMIVLQDETGGIEMLLNSPGLYTSFPVGQLVYIDIKQMVIGRSHQMLQIGWADTIGNMYGIAPRFIDTHIRKSGLPSTPSFLTNDEIDFDATQNLNSSYGRLVKLENCQFAPESHGKPLATEEARTLHTIQVTVGGESQNIHLSTSNKASFRNLKVPASEGTIFGILRRYDDTMHLLIRSADDLEFTDLEK